MDYLVQLNQTNSLVRLESIGSTFESRNIWTALISSSASSNRPVIYLECGMHAREWIAHSTCIWIIDEVRPKIINRIEMGSLNKQQLKINFFFFPADVSLRHLAGNQPTAGSIRLLHHSRLQSRRIRLQLDRCTIRIDQ